MEKDASLAEYDTSDAGSNSEVMVTVVLQRQQSAATVAARQEAMPNQ